MTPMERQVTSNLLRHAAGTKMFCPVCNDCLNWPTTVILDLKRRANQPVPQACIILCASCFKKREDKIRDMCAEAGFLMEVTAKDRPLPLAEAV